MIASRPGIVRGRARRGVVTRAFARAAAVAGFALIGACETTITTSDGTRPVPKPVVAPDAPRGATPNAIAVTFAPKPVDTNGNLRPDTLAVTAYLFAKPHPSPIHADGAFGFAIYAMGEAGSPDMPGQAPLRTWAFAGDAVAASRSRALAGACHEFTLSLLANRGSDALPVESVDLVAWFEPADGGERVWMSGVRGVQFAGPER